MKVLILGTAFALAASSVFAGNLKAPKMEAPVAVAPATLQNVSTGSSSPLLIAGGLALVVLAVAAGNNGSTSASGTH
ncbi:hypothetical protein GALL_528080 [mine drainage metagenome]|uniref:Uncharacterized protein n=1 Tax=mine drainage metagenome TaxID=410659 RepID=A0A1J5P399_9ZZZZ